MSLQIILSCVCILGVQQYVGATFHPWSCQQYLTVLEIWLDKGLYIVVKASQVFLGMKFPGNFEYMDSNIFICFLEST